MSGATYLIVGLGSIGRRHLSNLRKLAPAARIVVLRQSIDVDDSTPIPEGADALVGNIDAALEEQPLAALICSPAPFHLQSARLLAEAGVQLMIEKPIADRSDLVEAMIQTCSTRKQLLMTAYNFRFSDSCRSFRRRLLDGEIGRILSVSVDTGQYLPDWRPEADYRQGVSAQRRLGGGALLELSHEFDYLNWILGAPQAVFARIRNSGELDLDVEDCADLLIDYPQEVTASVHIDFLQRVPRRTCKVVGSGGTLIWDAIASEITLLKPGSDASVAGVQGYQRNDMYLKELSHFLDCVATGEPVAVDGRDGLQALRIVEAARLSAEYRRMVKLTELNG